MKKLLSILLALTMCLSVMTFTVSAAETFPTTLEAPSAVVISDQANFKEGEYNSNGTQLRVTLNLGADLSNLLSEGNTAEKYGLESNVKAYTQIDWSIDAKDDWKYNEGWDELKRTNDNEYVTLPYAVSGMNAETTQKFSILGFDTNESYQWTSYFSSLVPESVYTLVPNAWDDQVVVVDWTQHTIYVRARFVVQYQTGEREYQYLISDWSPVVGYGKDYKPFESPTSLEAPVISNLELTDEEFNGGPVVKYWLDNPESVKEHSAGAASISHYIQLDTEVSINGGAWTHIQGEYDISDGDRRAYLSTVAKTMDENSWVQLRTRYHYGSPYGDVADVYSDWSNIVEFGAPAWGNASEWATEELARADELGLIPETLEGADLTADITRAEFAAVTVKVYEALLGTPAIPAVNNPFTDTSDVEVLKAYNIGAVGGMSATTFAPNELLNREQAAAMLTRVFKKVSMPGWTLATDSQFTLPYEKPALFADDKDISAWAKDSVYFMVANNIINGVGNTKFAPKNVTSADEANGYANATREQALIIAVRMVENLKK